jgi:hypothetical protein
MLGFIAVAMVPLPFILQRVSLPLGLRSDGLKVDILYWLIRII